VYQDPGRLLLLYLWPAWLPWRPHSLRHHNGPGHGGGRLVN
jgi:hypothetical protein